MKHKTFSFSRFKALDEAQGEFEAVVAIFGNVDLGGDRIVKGAFANSLRKWAASGRPIPVVFSHQWADLDSHIGEVLEAKETDQGLWVRAQLDMTDPPAAKVWRLLKRGTLAEFSFAYDVVRERVANGANELLELDIIEVGPTLKGMNPATELIGVKALTAATSAATSADGRKQAVAGSFEERRELVGLAVRGRYGENDRFWVYVVATFTDRVIVAIHGEDSASYREIAYAMQDGVIVLGEERDVELQTTIVAKSQDGVTIGRDPVRAIFEVLSLGFDTAPEGKRSKAARARLNALGNFGSPASEAARELIAAGHR